MRIIFFGTPEFAAISLAALFEAHEVAAVVTQPDRPRGRGNRVSFSPVKEAALCAGVPVHQPEKIRGEIFYNKLRSYGADAFVVAAYGKKLPERLLNMTRFGAVNVHASLLPKYRGAAPIQRAIMNGEKITGISIMQMDAGIDTGDVILQTEIKIDENETGGGLHDKLARLGARALTEALFLLESGRVVLKKQDDSSASYAPMILKDTELIDWSKKTREIMNLIRALNPAPGAHTFYGGAQIKIFSAEAESNKDIILSGTPGKIYVDKNGIKIETGDGLLKINEIQKTGGKRMRSDAFLRGNKIEAGGTFG